jgi:NAD(P)-dependent dehydrogenase (short-subunit alcohol dehydrogenase family)
VGLVARQLKGLEEVRAEIQASGGQALSISANVSIREDVYRMASQVLETFGRVDILVAAAALNRWGYLIDHDDEAWLEVLKVNLYSLYLCDKAVLPSMIANRWGRIIHVSAMSAFNAAPGWSAQCAAKSGILGLTRALALEVADQGITVNAICPAWVRTPGADEWAKMESRAQGLTIEQYWKAQLQSYPIGRITESEEQAHLMLYIASEEAAALTGQAICLTGGSPW